ncbi:MAG: hypothetical protein ACOC1P_02835 [Minisyncoccales bacterium]
MGQFRTSYKEQLQIMKEINKNPERFSEEYQEKALNKFIEMVERRLKKRK